MACKCRKLLQHQCVGIFQVKFFRNEYFQPGNFEALACPGADGNPFFVVAAKRKNAAGGVGFDDVALFFFNEMVKNGRRGIVEFDFCFGHEVGACPEFNLVFAVEVESDGFCFADLKGLMESFFQLAK